MSKSAFQKFYYLGRLVYFVILSFIVMVPISPAIQKTSLRDSGLFQYIGWRILHGEILYRDVWDHKPPVIHILNAIGLSLSHNSTWGVWLVEIIFLLITIFLIYVIVRDQFSHQIAFVSSTIFLLSLPFVLNGGNLTTQYGMLFQLYILFVLLREDKRIIKFLVIGFILGILFLTKQNLVGSGLTVGLILIFEVCKNRKYKKFFQSLILMGTGFLSVIGIVSFYFWQNSGLVDFYNAVITYNIFYSSFPFGDKVKAIINCITTLNQNGLSVAALLGWAAIIIGAFTKRTKTNIISLYVIIGLPIELFFTGISGRTYLHYYMAVLPVFVLASAFFYNYLKKFLVKLIISSKTEIIFSILLILGLFVFQLIGQRRYSYYPFSPVVEDFRELSVSDFIKNNTSVKDYVLIIGAEAGINFSSKRISPTRYVYQYPLVKKDYYTELQIDEFIECIIKNKPKIIVVTDNTVFQKESLIYDPTYFLDKLYSQSFWSRNCSQTFSIPTGTLDKWKIYSCNWQS